MFRIVTAFQQQQQCNIALNHSASQDIVDNSSARITHVHMKIRTHKLNKDSWGREYAPTCMK